MALDDTSPLELLAERTRLQHTFSEVGVQITAIERALKQAERVSSGLAAYAADTRAESDIADIASLQTLMEQETGVPIIKSRLLRQLITMEPRVYFGRVDFKPDDQDDIMAVYVGTGWLFHHATGQKLVYDWRTPYMQTVLPVRAGTRTVCCADGRDPRRHAQEEDV